MSIINHIVDAILEDYSEPLVLHLHDRSTDFLTRIYAGKGYPVISHYVDERNLLEAIRPRPLIYGLGHGSPNGLIGLPMSGHAIRSALAKKRHGVYIWCNAAVYARDSGLSGFVSGMFISEVGEANIFGIQADQDEIDESNHLFAKLVRKWLDGDQTPVSRGYSRATSKVITFNSQRLYIFKDGVPDHEIHDGLSLAPNFYGKSEYDPNAPKYDPNAPKPATRNPICPECKSSDSVTLEGWKNLQFCNACGHTWKNNSFKLNNYADDPTDSWG